MVTGAAEDWPGVGIHSSCAPVTESVPLSFLYDACTDGRLICLSVHKNASLKEINEDLQKTRAHVIGTLPFWVASANPSLCASLLYVEESEDDDKTDRDSFVLPSR